MNERDRDNLEFLLSASPETIKDWFQQVSEDDHYYAEEIMNLYEQELSKKSKEIDLQISLLQSELTEKEIELLNEDYTEAKNVLSKFTLKN